MLARSPGRWQMQPWQRELAAAFTRPAELLAYLGLDPALTAPVAWPLLVPRGFAALMVPGDPADPLLRQVLPSAAEGLATPGYSTDPLAEAAARRAPGLLCKYRGRALLLVTKACAVHCRYCFRRHSHTPATGPAIAGLEAALQALAADPGIHEVILSGGDPLLLDDVALRALIARLAALPHLRRLRLHTRVPVLLPARITPTLVDLLTGTRLAPVMVIHTNHAAELGDAAAAALDRLGRARIPLLNQGVLLRGVNDSSAVLAALAERLFALGVINYYLHLLDPVQGAAHFAVPRSRARALLRALRAELPGYLVPRLVCEVAGAPSKLPIDAA
ncbi:MAG: EF-P beta-lysylation protein EpmB [Chromatiaceae bacterium]|nr:MAG: EF-P beta-lysylation protein EpmB [Chromatiaceae bacterium]